MVHAKHLVAVMAALALLMTAIFSVVGTVSVAENAFELDFLDETTIAEGSENVTVNGDGSWSVTGNFALAPNLEFDYTKTVNIVQKFTSDVPVKITLLDRDPDGVYGDHWIGLYDNFVGPEYYPAGSYDRTDNLSGIWTWNVKNSGWKNSGKATVRAIYVEFQGNPTATFNDLRLYTPATTTTTPAPTTTTTAPTQPRYTWENTASLIPLDTSKWSNIPVGGSDIIVTTSGNSLIFGNTAGNWPSAYTIYDKKFVVTQAKTAIEYDFVATGETNIYLFFGDSIPVEGSWQNDQFYSLTGGDVSGTRSGTIYLEDINLPAGAFDENGNVVISSIKIFAIGGASNNLVQVNKLNLLYDTVEIATTTTEAPTTTEPATTTTEPTTATTEAPTTTTNPAPVMSGDMDGNGVLNMADASTFYMAVSGRARLTDAQAAVADINNDGLINMMDALILYLQVSGQA
ncbi:MAG: dockerin type I repeat-containing protein [Clostridia bacterium]|nr:dockerin type I repeat-containing protein [Clostridia bacterium]